MSTYANYQSIADKYDSARSAVSSSWYVGAFLTKQSKPLSELHLLDAGCGTGNYAKAMLEAGVGKVTLFDASEGMLEKANEKLERFIKEGRVGDIRCHPLPEIPYDDNTFDLVMINNVLHHLDTSTEYPNFIRSMNEVYRVLKPGGVFINQMSFYHQILEGHWFFHTVPLALKRYLTRYTTPFFTQGVLTKAGFRNLETLALLNKLLYTDEVYFNDDGPLSPEVLASDSFWHFVQPDELAEAKKLCRRMKEDKTMKKFMEIHDAKRPDVGQVSLVIAMK